MLRWMCDVRNMFWHRFFGILDLRKANARVVTSVFFLIHSYIDFYGYQENAYRYQSTFSINKLASVEC